VQKVTAGGGGAFLHPTHDFDFRKFKKLKRIRRSLNRSKKLGALILIKTIWNSPTVEFLGALIFMFLVKYNPPKTKGFSLVNDYPAFDESRKKDKKNFWFIWNNKTFGIFTAIIYAVLAWLMRGKINSSFSWKKAFWTTVTQLIDTPLATLLVIMMLVGLVFFTDSNSKWYKKIAGTVHGLTHLAAIFLFAWLGYLLNVWVVAKFNITDPAYQDIVWFCSVICVSALGGYCAGALIMGMYLFVSLHIFGRHDNEAFSSLKIEDYKNFLRLHINSNGELTIYPLKIEKVPRTWNPVSCESDVEYYTPADGDNPALIEEPVTIK
jgi:hypothetical protein